MCLEPMQIGEYMFMTFTEQEDLVTALNMQVRGGKSSTNI